MIAIFKKDFASYFTSTLGYIVIGLYLMFSGYFFWNVCFLSAENNMVKVINNMLYVVFFLVPLITMRSFAEEKRQKTDQVLFTAPVKNWEIVCGKYLSAAALYLICNMIYFFYAIVLSVCVKNLVLNFGLLFSGFLGSLLLGLALLAINLFYSALTEYQIIAAVVGLGTGLVCMLYDSVLGAIQNFLYTMFKTQYEYLVLDKISLTGHYANLIKGVVDPADIIFYLSFIGLFLFITGRVLDKKRYE